MLRFILVVIAALLLAASFIRNLETLLRPRAEWTTQILDISSKRKGSASNYAYVPVGHPFVVTGAQTGFRNAEDGRPLRQEISEFERAGPAFDLYIQCQNRVMARDQDDVMSYYSIASIHQKPFKAWNRIVHESKGAAGYAPHESILFPVWHRPYVAMYEQTISKCAVSLAMDYPSSIRRLYYKEALNLRLPYWDWARDHSLPPLTNEPTCMIRTPTGIRSVTNPLYRYNFHPVPGTVGSSDENFTIGPYDSLPYTVRYLNINGTGTIEAANWKLNNEGQFMQLTYELLTKLNGSFAHFSNKAASENIDTDAMINIENLHNHVHELIGGHMGTQYAAFDPVFWLHHVNMDRILALWQAIYPESYVVPQINLNGTISTAPGSVEDIDSPLMPFASDGLGHMHTARTVRHIKDLGYSYPELQDWTLTPQELAANVSNIVELLYGNRDLWIPPEVVSLS